MIQLNISTEVPEYFKRVKKAEISKDLKIESFEKFTVKSFNEYIIQNNLYKKFENSPIIIDVYKSIFATMIEFKLTYNINALPLCYSKPTNQMGELISKNPTFLFEKIDNNILNVNKNDILQEKLTYFNIQNNNTKYYLLDLYDNNSPLNMSTDYFKNTVDFLIEKLHLQPLIDWFEDGKIIDIYSEKIANHDSQIELAIYNAWIEHNVNLLNKTTKKI